MITYVTNIFICKRTISEKRVGIRLYLNKSFRSTIQFNILPLPYSASERAHDLVIEPLLYNHSYFKG